MKLDYQEIHHNYITRLVIFAIFLFKEQRRQENVFHYNLYYVKYRQSVISFIRKRIRYDINLTIEVGPKIALEDQRDLQIESLLNNFDETGFLNLIFVNFNTGLKEKVTLQIDLNEEERYESYLYS